MSIATQLSGAMKKLIADEFEDAVVGVSVALSATARREEPDLGDKAACRSFLDSNLDVISKIAWVAFGVAMPINFRYRRLDKRNPGIAVCSMSEMLYDVVRCTAVHEAKLPDNLIFVRVPIIKTGNDGELVLPIDLIYGLLMAVVASPKNSGERIDGDPLFHFGGKSASINNFWGDGTALRRMIGISHE